ncbi:acetyl-CoA carboxylase biotin carboxyl carrier protein subunit [Polycladomyces abyssicola]|jgi:acetyl-CoA carboxylase biotin carboxyl carrier protein|uniref:Acetyl-CoA carboxylase biotin carboxyl carrier protein subunit n=1 Tax=Polycladomyces abyssicola TaxID=1125966 RepID=A0A8D5UHJ3_9BACL|nr:acetyl-CoA carboxylase biotin carboxyl carrier protein subunit [Polycladomyces abyssicola]BCU82268.1 acetyl-CoA carboxylase biotin carboxyl carrier protein subunit [Polycladomyces abyssicola]
MKTIQANMAGTVLQVLVKPGDEVKSGQDVMILESMKMEIPIAAEADGTVKSVPVEIGSFVGEGDVLVELE